MSMRVVRLDGPPVKFLDGRIKLPSAWNAIFAELLPPVAVRRSPGNTTLYSVTYHQMKTKLAKEKSASQSVSGPLIVTVSQSDLRAKKFHVLVKMRVNVRLPEDESHRYGVAVAVDEVAECVFVAYTRDEQTRSASQRRLLLRQVKLTLGATDARGVRRLQRPPSGKLQSITFEAKNYCREVQAYSASRGASRKADTRVSVQQLALDGAALLLYLHVRSCFRGSSDIALPSPGVAQLKLRKKSASMDLSVRLPISSHPLSGFLRSAGQNKLAIVDGGQSARQTHYYCRDIPYFPMPTLVNMGPVEVAACTRIGDAMKFKAAPWLPLLGGQSLRTLMPLDSHGHFKVFHCKYGDVRTEAIVAVRGLGDASQHNVVGVRLVEVADSLANWSSRHPTVGAFGVIYLYQANGDCLLTMGAVQKKLPLKTTGNVLRAALRSHVVVLRANLRSFLPPTTACANCHVAIRQSPPIKKKVCKLCQMKGFVKYSWLFGCHFCSAACLRDAWPQHSRLHRMPPLKRWTDADWERWRRDNSD